jgi:hypothetical protein
MPASRYLVLLAGILGVLALFQPLIKLGRGPISLDLSAYDLSFGLKKTHVALDARIPTIAKQHIPPDLLETRDDIKLVADASRAAALAFAPAALILLIGIFCVKKKRTPRALAIVAGVLGLLSAGAWYGVRFAVFYGIAEEPALGRLHFKAVFAAQVLLVTGVLAVLGAV